MNKNKIYFVGAGPGDPELLTLKGRRLIDAADVVLYAGSLVNPALLHGIKAEIYNSAGLNLDQCCQIMVDAVRAGKMVVRLHTGDPAIYGAIKEQMCRLDLEHITYEVIPGVTSATAAAAAIKTELTLPEISQTIIITRQAGRTPVPPKERLQSLAAHQATMMIFLSVGMIDTVVDELIAGGYPPTTPIAVIEKASWVDEKKIIGSLETISDLVKKAEIKKTAMIIVGEVINGKLAAESKLYDAAFTHGYRSASNSSNHE
jgi:precorrin-4/cobalt-precorrin-4 C11-methyltransferase